MTHYVCILNDPVVYVRPISKPILFFPRSTFLDIDHEDGWRKFRRNVGNSIPLSSSPSFFFFFFFFFSSSSSSYSFFFFFFFFFHWHYSPLWALACRTMSFRNSALEAIASPIAQTLQTRKKNCHGRLSVRGCNAHGIHTLDTQVNVNEGET